MVRTALVLLMSLSAAGCQQSPPPEAVVLPVQVRLAYPSQHDASLVHLAVAKGFFREEGVIVLPLIHSFGKQALEAVLEGKADLATVAETPFMFAALRGEKVSIVASIFSSGQNHAIVASRRRGVASPGELRGKRIGFTPGTTSDIFLDSFLSANSIAPHEVIPVPLKPDQMLDALMAGEVDAISAWTPTLKIIARRLGKECSVFYDQDIYTETCLLAGSTPYIDQNQVAVRRVLRALLKAEEFASQHPMEAKALIADALKVAPDILSECWNEGRFRVALDHALLITLEDETRWAVKHRLAPDIEMPNYLEYIDFRALYSVKPEAIDIKR